MGCNFKNAKNGKKKRVKKIKMVNAGEHLYFPQIHVSSKFSENSNWHINLLVDATTSNLAILVFLIIMLFSFLAFFEL